MLWMKRRRLLLLTDCFMKISHGENNGYLLSGKGYERVCIES